MVGGPGFSNQFKKIIGRYCGCGAAWVSCGDL